MCTISIIDGALFIFLHHVLLKAFLMMIWNRGVTCIEKRNFYTDELVYVDISRFCSHILARQERRYA